MRRTRGPENAEFRFEGGRSARDRVAAPPRTVAKRAPGQPWWATPPKRRGGEPAGVGFEPKVARWIDTPRADPWRPAPSNSPPHTGHGSPRARTSCQAVL